MSSSFAPTRKQIKAALTDAGLTKVDTDVLSKCVALASTLHLTTAQMAEVWEAYSLNKQNLTELTPHQFEAYRNELIKVSQVTPDVAGSSSNGGAILVSRKDKRHQTTNMVTPPPTAKRPHKGEKPGAAATVVEQAFVAVAADGGVGSPSTVKSSAPPAPPTTASMSMPVPRYEERTRVGQVVASYPAQGATLSTRAKGGGQPHRQAGGRSCTVSATAATVGRYNIKKPYRHMFTTLDDRAAALERHLVERRQAIVDRHGLLLHAPAAPPLTEQQDEDDGGQQHHHGAMASLEEVNVPRQDRVTVVGRICNEAHEGKLNDTSVVLEGSSATSGGARINVDLAQLHLHHEQGYSLFPGQIVAIEGMNPTGRKFTAHRLLEGAPPPPVTTSVKDLRNYSTMHIPDNGRSALRIVTACGPFTTSNTMDYQPFVDLMHVILEDPPDVVILTGPFVDMRQPSVESGNETTIEVEENDQGGVVETVVTYEALFAHKISGLIEEALMAVDDVESGRSGDAGCGSPTQFVLIPALEDATAQWVYPQPPLQDRLPKGGKLLTDVPGSEGIEFGTLGLYRLDDTQPSTHKDKSQDVADASAARPRVHCLSNPCTFQINELVFGVTSTDVLFQMSAEETNANLPPGSRLRRIAQHLIQQESYYPLFPPNKSVNLDLKRQEGWKMPCRPDVLIIPSKLTPFCAPVLENTMVINPGHLTKGTTGGTYAIMEIPPIPRDTLDEAIDSVQLPHNVQDRIQVQVKRI